MTLQDLYNKREPDSIKDCFRSDGYIQGVELSSDDGVPISMETIPPFLRTILITDGTVTKILEAYYWEPVVVEKDFQYAVKTTQNIDWLQTEAGDEILLRGVQLRGGHSGNCYATAFSAIRHYLLPGDLREALMEGSLGIGMLIRDSGLESYRQILDVGVKRHKLAQINIHHPPRPNDYIFRTYRIFIAHEPVIIIRESFPWALYV